jgi:hypothetical protein
LDLHADGIELSRAMPERDGVTKSSDKFSFDELRRANQQPQPKRQADLVRYDYYASHPEHRRRPLSRRQLRRRAIRGGF